MEKWTDSQKLENTARLNEEQYLFYQVFCKMFLLAINRGLRMVVENPRNDPNYLNLYFPIKPTIIDQDRRKNGDYYTKPTQYWFVNCEPKNNLILEPITWMPKKTIEWHKGGNREIARSMISPQYANRFIRQYLIGGEEQTTTESPILKWLRGG